MNILIAVDSFKGSATSYEIGQTIKSSIEGVKSEQDRVEFVAVSDGGEGSIEVLERCLKGKYREVLTVDPLGRNITIEYFITKLKQQSTAIIESASIIGLNYIDIDHNEGYDGNTYGVGQVLIDALKQGVQEIIITMGGSATTDGGLGMLQALGVEFLDQEDQVISANENPLIRFEKIKWNQAKELFGGVTLRIATDVTSLYHGKQGAAVVFGKQKGLYTEQIKHLDNQLKKFLVEMEKIYSVKIQENVGSGASGGLSGALLLLGGKIESGFELISELISLKKRVEWASVVITGEGSLDSQSSKGKLVKGVCDLAESLKTPVVAICGRRDDELGELKDQLVGAFSIQTGPISTTDAVEKKRTLSGVGRTSREIFQLLKLFEKT